MDVHYLLRGLLLGLSIAAPVGPIGVLCIRRTLADGRAVGFVSGLGAATADGFYGAVAAFGLAFVSGVLVGEQRWIRLIGGVFLAYLGLRTFLAPPATEAASRRARGLARGLLGAYATTLALTLTNPLTILSFAALFAGLGLASAPGGYGSAGVLVVGVFCGSALWWLLLSGGVSLLRTKLTPARLRWVNRGSGIFLMGFGLLALASLWR